MSDIKVSLFASAVRPQLWPSLFKSLEGTSVKYEVVFSGNCTQGRLEEYSKVYDLDFIYIHTANIKPAQCYEIARRHCSGEVVVWVADDCAFPDDVIGKAYNRWKSENNEKLILSIQTKESGYGLPNGQLFDMRQHRFYGGQNNSPLMAPLGMMSRKFLNDLGGIDVRYVCGQYENDICMRAIVAGGSVEVFGGADCFIDIDHLGKSIAIGESRDELTFLNRPFATGYEHDRRILEGSWSKPDRTLSTRTITPGNKVFVRLDEFQPFEDKDLLTISQSHKGKWQ